MKKLIVLFLLFFSFLNGFSQIKMGDFPLLLGRGDSVQVPVLVPGIGGTFTNRKMWAHDLAYGKIDSITISNDSVFVWNSGTKIFRYVNGSGTSLGYTPENVANKTTTLTNSATQYPSTSAVTAALSGYADVYHHNYIYNDHRYDTLLNFPNDSSIRAKSLQITNGSSKISDTKVITDSSISHTIDVVEANLNRNNLGGGALTIANGGTNAITANAALNNLLPSQTGNNTKVLTTDGTNSSWQPGSGGGISGITILNNGTPVNSTPRPKVNMIPSTNMAVTTADNSGSNQVDITVATTGISPGWINPGDAPYNVDLTGATPGTAGMRLAISTAASTGKAIFIPGARILIDSTLKLPSKVNIFGVGYGSAFFTNTASISIFETTDSNTIHDLRLIGFGYMQSESVITNQNGVKINGNGNSVFNLFVEELRGSGVWIFSSTGSAPGGGNMINRIIGHHNTVGIYNQSGAEYSTISNSECNDCYIGFWEIGGNTQWSNLQGDWCQTGFRLTSGSNSDHNKLMGGTFNHCTFASIDVQSCSFTWTFFGIETWNGAALKLGSVGTANEVIFETPTISNTIIQSTNASGCIFRNGNFRTPVTISGTTGVSFENDRGTGAYGPLYVLDNRQWSFNGTSYQFNQDQNITILAKTSHLNFKVHQAGAPIGGDSTYTEPTWEGKYIWVFREGIRQYPGTSDGYEFDSSSGTVIFHPSLSDSERIQIDAFAWPTVNTLPNYDTDAAAYFAAVSTAGGSLTLSQKNNYNAFVVATKAHGTYSHVKIAYPVMGGTLTSNGVNGITPGTNNLTYTGSPTADAISLIWSANTDWAETGFNVSTGLTQNSYGLGYYSQTSNSVNGTDIGINNNTVYAVMWVNNSASTFAFLNDAGAGTSGSNSGTIGVFHATRTSSTAVTIYKNGSSIATGSHTSSALPSTTVRLNNTYTVGGNRKCGFAWVDDGMNSTQAASFYADLQAFLTAVGK